MCFLKSFLDFPLFLIKESQGSLLFLIRIVQFSRCCFSLSLRELNYYITFSSLCQVLFQNFFSEVFPFVLIRFRAAYILYHFLSGLSSSFFKISFRKFLFAFFTFKTALILYHFLNPLSIPFQKVFCDNFFRHLSGSFTSHAAPAVLLFRVTLATT